MLSILILLIAISISGAAAADAYGAGNTTYDDGSINEFCRSNQTHIAWRSCANFPATTPSGADRNHQKIHHFVDTLSSAGDFVYKLIVQPSLVLSRQRQQQQSKALRSSPLRSCFSKNDEGCCWQTKNEAEKHAYQYLRENVMQFDVPFLETLGFKSNESMPDGLADGLVGPTIELALQSKIDFERTDALPIHIWHEYVLNYANINEARSNWRELLWNKFKPLLAADAQDDISTTVRKVNTDMWKILAPAGQESIVFKSGQTPLIFDPMSVMNFGYASCTGTAILFVNALRTVGVPARVAGTPAWDQNRSHGNHNWVEVWKDGKWYFLEPTINGSVDFLERDPCERWFCSSKHFDKGKTKVFSARLDSSNSDTFYRIAWEWSNGDVPGEEMTSYYARECGECA